MTAGGEAVEASLEVFVQTLARRGELQSVALEDIRARLISLDRLAHDAPLDAAKIHEALRDLANVFTGLSNNAEAFMASLARTIELQRAEPSAVVAFKNRLLDYLQRFIGDLGIDLAARTEPLAPSVCADIALVERVFENLLDNALRHTPPGGRVEIHTQTRSRFMDVAVSDSGAGVAASDLPHVFERYFQRRDQAAEPGTGLGLGLAIVRRIVELHGGCVSMASTPGIRTTVTFSLPPWQQRLTARSGQHPARTKPSIVPMRSAARSLISPGAR